MFGGRNKDPSNHHCNKANKLGIKIFMKQTKGPVKNQEQQQQPEHHPLESPSLLSSWMNPKP
jgi:hypothetical protein